MLVAGLVELEGSVKVSTEWQVEVECKEQGLGKTSEQEREEISRYPLETWRKV